MIPANTQKWLYEYGNFSCLLRLNNTSKEYFYNAKGDLTKMNEKIDGATYTHEYTYDNRGNVLTYKYPSGYTITNEYNTYGYKTGVKEGSTYIWRVSGSDYINEMGQIKEYLLGSNNIKTKWEYNGDFELTGINTKTDSNTTLFDYSYLFNHSTGNLAHRKDNIKSMKEEFNYDNKHRLDTIKRGVSLTNVTKYHDNSNIQYKYKAGNYDYLSPQPHAVTQITDNFGNSIIHHPAQEIHYNSFQKTATIDENGYSYSITYGTDQQRKKTTLKNKNTIIETKVYSGRYEKLTTPTGTKELHYIPTPSGTVAVNIKTNGASGTTYFLLKDHLGSIMKVVAASGSLIEEHSYDAWGNHRSPSDWTLTDFSSALGIRGYTGHEMLPMFQLINMNGRMYDPVIGRVLSPDNYVQSPFNAQNYNRYSYALNNPLKYTDPDGEWNWIVAAAGLVYGYVSHGVINKDWGWKALGSGVLTGAMWGIGYTASVQAAGITPVSYAAQSAVSSTVNQFMPSMRVPVGDNFTINASFGLGVGASGLIAGMNFSGTLYGKYGDNPYSITAGVGASDNMHSVGGGFSVGGYGASYYRTKYGNAIGPDGKPNPQTVGGWGLNIKDFSLRIENDKFGDKSDRWRTSAVEIGYGNFVIGKSVYTNEPDETLDRGEAYSRVWKRSKDSYADGRVFSSPFYLGLRQGGMVTRLGIDHPIVQDATQNGWHLFGSPSSPLFPTPYKEHDDYYFSTYRYDGYYNPYSLYFR